MRKMMSLVAILVLVGCGEDTDKVITEVDPDPTGSYQAVLAPLARPGAAGTVTITQYGSYFVAEGTFTGLLPNAAHQWKAYFGNCTTKLAQITANANPPALANFTTDANGAGSASGTVFARFKSDSTYNIRVYTTAAVTPAANDTVFHACGMITKK
jgi:hypothetical protein